MAIFGVVVEDHKLAKEFFKETKERLAMGNIAKNPFSGGVVSFISLRKYKEKGEAETRVDLGYNIKMKPIYPNFALVGAVFLTATCIIWPHLWIMLVTAFFYLISLFWSGRFYYYMLKLGLKRKGYKGSIRYLKPKDILEEVYFNGNK